MTRAVTVFGSVNLDLIAHVESLPKPGETVTGGRFLSAPGGKGANQALAAARAGAATSLVGAIGNDAFSEQTLPLLRDAGVNLNGLRRLEDPTGTALILVDEAGENIIAVASGANYALKKSDLTDFGFTEDSILLCQLEMDLEATAAVIAQAKSAGATVILNLAPFRPEAAAFLCDADLLIMNAGEAEALAAVLGMESAKPQDLKAETGCSIVVTLGGDGLTACLGTETLTLTAYSVPVVDTVGAGDAFCGYLAAYLSSNGDIDQEGLRYATAAGGLTCTTQGAQTAIPDYAKVCALLDSRLTLP